MNKKGQLDQLYLSFILILFGAIYIIAESQTNFSTKLLSNMLPTSGFTSFILPLIPFLIIMVDMFLIAFIWRNAFG